MRHSVGGKGFVAPIALRAFAIDTLVLGVVAGSAGQTILIGLKVVQPLANWLTSLLTGTNRLAF
jgi:hypothetical protein